MLGIEPRITADHTNLRTNILHFCRAQVDYSTASVFSCGKLHDQKRPGIRSQIVGKTHYLLYFDPKNFSTPEFQICSEFSVAGAYEARGR